MIHDNAWTIYGAEDLEELEKLDGILIATTNLADNLDPAFERRFVFKLKFDRPTLEAKQNIWQSKLAWLAEEQCRKLAADYDFSGGEIDNIVRKVIMDGVINGTSPDFSFIVEQCKSERLMSSKHTRIEYMQLNISDKESVYVFRDIGENSKCIYNYTHCIELGKPGYTKEVLEKQRENFGVYVLQSNSYKEAKEIFYTYKQRWGIETFYQYLKNSADFNDLMIQDYCKEQGLAFLMLVTGQIHSKMINAVKSLRDKTISTTDIMLMAKFLKMERKGNTWTCRNKRKKDLDTLEKLGFKPLNVYVDNNNLHSYR